ncbi:MAG: Gfo/Idh/MocA family protein [Acidobacteriota bacterium]
MNKKIKIAVLGTGSIGLRHLRVLNSLNIETIAIPTRKERFEELSRDGYKVAYDIEEAKNWGATGIIICTNTSRHIRDCQEALELDYCILCEKPLSSSTKEAKKIKDKVKGNLFVGYNLRFDDGFNKLFHLANDIGEIYYIYSECRSYLPDWRKGRNYLEGYAAKPKEGGVLLDLSHEIDYLNFFYNKPLAIIGTTKNWGILKIAEEEFASADCEYDNKSSSTIVLDYLNKNHSRKCLVSSIEKTISYDFLNKHITIMQNGKVKYLLIKRKKDTLYQREIEEFISVIKGKKKQKLCDYDEAVYNLIVIDGWKLSSKSGRKVTLKYVN